MMQRIIIIICFFLLSGCALFGQHQSRHHKTTSLVNFLYPDGVVPNDVKKPLLRLPLRVGLAFIPDASRQQAISPALKLELLNQVKAQFNQLRYVDRIEVIPNTYMRNHNQKSHFKQIADLYQLDVLALVSYDQIVNRHDNLLSLTYLTIVGSYIFKGTELDTSTLIDLAVIDVETKRLLFRAAGTHTSNDRTAEAYKAAKYDKNQARGFTQATAQLSENLAIEINQFTERLHSKEPQQDIKVVARKGYVMAADGWLLVVLISLFCWRLYHNKQYEI